MAAPLDSPPVAVARHFRLAIVVSHPTQYYSPWFRWLSQHAEISLRVFYLWDFGVKPTRDPQFETTFAWDTDLTSGYDWELVPNVSPVPGTFRFRGLDNPTLGARLAQWSPSAILLFGYAYKSALRVILWARLHRVPLIFRGDSHLLGRGAQPWSRRFAVRLLYQQFIAFAYVGRANYDYFRSLGVPKQKLWFAPHAIDDQLFDPSQPAVKAAAQQLRQQLNIPVGARVLLFAGKLIPAKQPFELLRAFAALNRLDAVLVFVGDGAEKERLVEYAAQHVPQGVRFLPFANQSEMPARYLLADVFTLPSRGFYETWGLAVNEAMHMGVPCIVSDRVGCQQDLVTDGDTGWVFRADELAELTKTLARALDADLPAFRPRVAARIQQYTYARAAAGLLQAIASVDARDGAT